MSVHKKQLKGKLVKIRHDLVTVKKEWLLNGHWKFILGRLTTAMIFKSGNLPLIIVQEIF